uniref:Osteoclast-stimulating factor 1 n=1 Tax=Maylandia zebra TaxID=106582 RepID=A0A3P9CT29_9CICH
SLTAGDIIVNIRRDEGGWWEGELGGRRGLFPDNFVREIKKEGKRDGGQASTIRPDLANGSASPVLDSTVRPGRKGEQIRKRRCKAAFSYVPQHEDELELKIGDVIEIIAEVEEGWWEGVLNGKTGMFPSNFTKEILTDSETPSLDSQEENRSGRTNVLCIICVYVDKDSPSSESDGGDSRSETGSEIPPKKLRGFGFGNIFKDQPIKLRPRSMDVDSEVDKVSHTHPAVFVSFHSNKALFLIIICKVLFPYEAQNEDELTIKDGDIINIITKDCADAGWWMGEIGGRQGVFPDNFVKLLEVEKEVKLGDLSKPTLPSLLPKKPLLPKSSASSSSQPPRRPERPPTLASVHTQTHSDTENALIYMDLDAIVSSTEKLSHPTASRPRVTDRRPRSQIITPSSLSCTDLDSPIVEVRKDKERVKDNHDSVSTRSVDASLRKGVPTISVRPCKVPLPAKPSILNPPNSSHRSASPSSSSGLSPSPELRHSPQTPLSLEELRNQLRDLRASIDLLKSQHRQEMKQLATALDEERTIRINLQMEVEHIKKSLSK